MKEEFVLNTVHEAMNECAVMDRENLTRYDLAHTGIWGEAVSRPSP
jgi:hypothetical protein